MRIALKTICSYPHPIRFDDNLRMPDQLPQLYWTQFYRDRSKYCKHSYIPDCSISHPMSWFKRKDIGLYRIHHITWRKGIKPAELKKCTRSVIPLDAFK